MKPEWATVIVTVLLWLFGETLALVVMVSKAFAWRAVAEEQMKRMRVDIEASERKATDQGNTINTIMQSLGEIKTAVGFLVEQAQHPHFPQRGERGEKGDRGEKGQGV